MTKLLVNGREALRQTIDKVRVCSSILGLVMKFDCQFLVLDVGLLEDIWIRGWLVMTGVLCG